MSKYQLTPAMTTALKSWGWIYIGRRHSMDFKWHKYEGKTLMAQDGDGTWDQDFASARLATISAVRICFHGTTEEKAKKILVEGFNIGTYFAAHLESALEFGGEYVFFVEFDEMKFNGPMDWQFHLMEHVSPAKIKRLVRYMPKTIYDVEAAKLLAAEVWVPTMELRRQLKHHNHILQQKWERAGTGDSEWREVPTVDEEGEPYA